MAAQSGVHSGRFEKGRCIDDVAKPGRLSILARLGDRFGVRADLS